MMIKCPHCGRLIEGKLEEEIMVTVRYWVKGGWPYSIDDKPYGTDKISSIEVPLSETYRRADGKRYYRLQSGHGVYTELVAE